MPVMVKRNASADGEVRQRLYPQAETSQAVQLVEHGDAELVLLSVDLLHDDAAAGS